MYEDEDDQEEGPKSSFATYLAEGDVLFNQSEYKKALDSYSLALDQQPGDKNCLVARSKCYLQLGDTAKALADAEESLVEDPLFHKGLYHKAEALYADGQFETALVFYHRGYNIRPELQVFRLGIQKAKEAIDNAIGERAGIRLENKGDLSFFQKQDDLKKSKGYSKPKPQRAQPQHQTTRGKPPQKPVTSDKVCKVLLGQLYEDKKYLDKLLKEYETTPGDHEDQGESSQADEIKKTIHDLVEERLQYFEKKFAFWGQEEPLYTRQKSKMKPKRQTKPTDVNTEYILQALEEIDTKLDEGDAEGSLKLAQSVMKKVQASSEKDLKGKQDILGNLHSCIGNAFLEMDNVPKALEHHKKDLNISKKIESSDGKSRALDNLGRCYAKQGDFAQAIDCWTDKIKMSKSALETTWLNHEIGRCHLEMKNYQDAKEFGDESLKAAVEAEDKVWQLNATVLISQAHVKMAELKEALESFQKALDLAKTLGDEAAEAAISKAIGDVENRLAQESSKEESDSGKEETKEEEGKAKDSEDETARQSDDHEEAKESNPPPEEDKQTSETEEEQPQETQETTQETSQGKEEESAEDDQKDKE